MSDLAERLQIQLGAEYLIQRELGGGGMSRVFLARETALARDVVIKVLPPDLAASVSAERFRREIMLAAALNCSPNRSRRRAGGYKYTNRGRGKRKRLRMKRLQFVDKL